MGEGDFRSHTPETPGPTFMKLEIYNYSRNRPCTKNFWRGLEKNYSPECKAKSRIWGAKTPEPITTKLRTPGAIQYLWRSVKGVKFWLFSLSCFVAFETLSHCRASVWISGPVAGQPASPWQPFCVALVGVSSSCYPPSMMLMWIPVMELWHILPEYLICRSDQDIWPIYDTTGHVTRIPFRGYVPCYECMFICLNDCLAYLLCIVYFRDIN